MCLGKARRHGACDAPAGTKSGPEVIAFHAIFNALCHVSVHHSPAALRVVLELELSFLPSCLCLVITSHCEPCHGSELVSESITAHGPIGQTPHTVRRSLHLLNLRLVISLLYTYTNCSVAAASMSGWFTTFLNCRLCIGGKLIADQMVVSDDTGLILPRTGYIGGDAVDLEDGIIAPGFLELQTNGLLGFHFTHFANEQQYAAEIDKAAKYFVSQGVTGFWGTVATVSSEDFQKVGNSLSHHPISSTREYYAFFGRPISNDTGRVERGGYYMAGNKA